jgi:hypothetical protein
MQRFGSLAVRLMAIGDSAQNVYFRFTFAGLRRLKECDVCDCFKCKQMRFHSDFPTSSSDGTMGVVVCVA